MEALVAQVEQERPKALLVSGDLTFNGEYQSFVDLANFFKQIESFGTKVLVEPGNHDIADGWARKFIGEQNYKTRQLTHQTSISHKKKMKVTLLRKNKNRQKLITVAHETRKAWLLATLLQ